MRQIRLHICCYLKSVNSGANAEISRSRTLVPISLDIEGSWEDDKYREKWRSKFELAKLAKVYKFDLPTGLIALAVTIQ